MKQWELPNGAKVKLPSGRIVKFMKMDGAYAHWDFDGVLKIGNYEEFERTDKYYKVIQQ